MHQRWPHPTCKLALFVFCHVLLMDSQYQHHGRLHQRSVILFFNRGELRWYHRRKRVKSMKAYTVDTLWQRKSHSSYICLWSSSTNRIQLQKSSCLMQAHHQNTRVPSWAQQIMHCVLTVPQHPNTMSSNLGHTSNPSSFLVFPPWSEVTPHVLW